MVTAGGGRVLTKDVGTPHQSAVSFSITQTWLMRFWCQCDSVEIKDDIFNNVLRMDVTNSLSQQVNYN